MAGPGTERPAHAAARALDGGARALAQLGRALRERGLTERAVRTCFGVRSVVHVERRARALPTPAALPPAAIAPWLLAAARPLPLAPCQRGLGDAITPLIELGLIQIVDDQAVPALRLLPVGEALCACPPTPAGEGGNPDDSSEHLLGAIEPTRVPRWLDLGTGNGFAPLSAAGRAGRVLATDIDDDALACARLGVALSAASGIELGRADLFEGVEPGPWDRISFNAPIPAPDDDILARFASRAPDYLADDGAIVVHARAEPGDPWRRLAGEVSIARYTPDDVRPAFAVLRWRPHRPDRLIEATCSLTPEQPHIVRSHLPDVG